MATVYLAHDLRHEREVAIKVLHPDLGAALGAERFLSRDQDHRAAAATRTSCRCSIQRCGGWLPLLCDAARDR
jgi:hypothetical protein